jgi:hypothetical protein
MQTMAIPPDQNSYSISAGSDDTVEVALDGGASRRRADKDQATRTIAVQWSVDDVGYNYLQAFYRTATAKGSMPFLCGLVNDQAIDNYTCWFVDKTFVLSSTMGNTFVVTANLEVLPTAIDETQDQSVIDAYVTYGDQIQSDFLLLQQLVNNNLQY